MLEFFTAISVGCAKYNIPKSKRALLEKLQKLGVLESTQTKDMIKLKDEFLIGIVDTTLSKSHSFLTPLHPQYKQDCILKSIPRNVFRGDIILAKKERIKQGKIKGVMRYKSIARFLCVLEAKESFDICVLLQHKGTIYAFSLQNGQRFTPKASQKSLRTLPPHCVIKIDLRSLEIHKVLGVLDDPNIDKQIVLEQHAIDQDFTPQSLLLAQSYGTRVLKSHYPHRRDYTHLAFCVIDPKGAKDHDDAIYYDIASQTLYVAIADVSEYVSKNSALDTQARARGFSVYFPDSVVPMLPFALSSELCSLQKNRLRLALVWEISLKNGQMQHHALYEGIIKAKECIDYESLDSALTQKKLPQSLKWLYAYVSEVKKLRANRLKIGYDLHSPNPNIHIDSMGKVTHIDLDHTSLAHHIIEESMLLANIAAAQMLHAHTPNGLYRIHQPPKENKIFQLLDALQDLGAPIMRSKLKDQFDAIQHWAKQKSERFAQIIDTLIIRSFSKACYSATPSEHFGLGFALYTHFTSPIRRYGDLCVHRILKCLLYDAKGLEYLIANMESIAQELNLKQKNISYLERDFSNLKSVRYVLDLLAQNPNKPIVCEAILLDDSIENDGFAKCLALDLIPNAYILLQSCGEFEKFAIFHVRITGADLIAREIYGTITKAKSTTKKRENV